MKPFRKKLDKKKITFQELFEKNKKELVIVVTNLTLGIPQYFHHSTFPNFVVSKAVRASISIPDFFHPVLENISSEEEKDVLVDGGMSDNFAIQVFDELEYFQKNPISGTCLGIMTRGDPKKKFQNVSRKNKPKNIVEFQNEMMYLLISNLDKIKIPYKYNIHTISINNIEVSPIDFFLKEEQEIELAKKGVKSAREFFHV